MVSRIREYGSEYDWRANDNYQLPPGQYQPAFEKAQKFRSGRDALKAVAAVCKRRYRRVLLPALCCESMVSPFTMHGIAPVFYRLLPDYTADIADVTSKLAQDTILLYGSYFGMDPFDETVLLQIKKTYPGVLFLEDRTQDIMRVKEQTFKPDVTIASIRKWTAIGDGGLLWSEKLRCAPGEQETAFASLRTKAMQMKAIYLEQGDPSTKQTYRQMLGAASEMLDESADFFAMTQASEELLARLDIAKMYHQRQENARILKAALADVADLKLITQYPERSTLYFPVLVKNQQKVQTALAQAGIYCPVLWPVPQEAAGICPVAEHTATHMLGVPCDHRYTPADMEFIAQQIVRAVHE